MIHPISIIQIFNPFMNYFHHLQTKVKNGFQRGIEYGQQTLQKTSQVAKGIFQISKMSFGYTKDLVKVGFEFAKKQPMYEQYITPIRPFDYKLIGTSAGLFILISVISLKRFGLISVYPNTFLGVLTSACILTILKERRNHFFNPEICDKLYEMQTFVNEASKNKTNHQELQNCLNDLNSSKYEHKKDKWEDLKKKIDDFINFLKKEIFECKRDNLVFNLEDLVKNNPDDLLNDLINKLKQDKEFIQKEEITKLLKDITASNPKFSGISQPVLELFQFNSLEQEKNALITMINGIITPLKGKTFKERQVNNEFIIND